MIKIITNKRKTTYSHKYYIAKQVEDFIQVIRVTDRKKVDEILASRIKHRKECIDIEIYGEEK